VTLPASGWKALGTTQRPEGWRFHGASGTPIRSIMIKNDRIVLHGGRSAWSYSLDEPAQGRIALSLQLGSDPGWCTATSANMDGNPPSTAKSDYPGLFKASRGSVAPASCPPPP
jgi:hypothetical protein